MKAKVITITNQKGGVAKTTTATSLAAALSLKNKKVLLIDTDPQCNASDTYRAKIQGMTTLYDVLVDKVPVNEAIQKTEVGEIIASDNLLSKAESLLNETGKEYTLKKAINIIINDYDYIIIDTPPTLGVLLINALTAADELIIPITADRYGLHGLSQLNETINLAQEYTNPNLRIAGLLLVKYNPRTRISKDVTSNLPTISKEMNTIVFNTTIRESTAAKEAQALRNSLFDYAPYSTTAIDYNAFTKELLGKEI